MSEQELQQRIRMELGKRQVRRIVLVHGLVDSQ